MTSQLQMLKCHRIEIIMSFEWQLIELALHSVLAGDMCFLWGLRTCQRVETQMAIANFLISLAIWGFV